ncbi:MAG: basic amino acid ABC transporter substrate-binding protein [Actinomycetota bacterium]
MRRIRLFTSIAAVLALTMLACGGDTTPRSNGTSTPTGTGAGISTVSIGQCQTAQGTQAPAAKKDVPYQQQLKQPGRLHVGSDNAYPPFEEIKPGTKNPVGFDVDLYTEVAKRLGLTVVSTTTDFDGLFTQSIPTGQLDIGVSAITIKEERKKTVDFTVPYFQADLSLAINSALTPTIKTVDDLAGRTIGAQKATTGEDCAKFLVSQGKGKEVKSFDDAAVAFQDLVAGRVAAIVNDRPASEGFIQKNASLKVVQVIRTQEQYGFAISKDKPDLREAINAKLLEIMKDGTYATIYKKWFETEPPFPVPLS